MDAERKLWHNCHLESASCHVEAAQVQIWEHRIFLLYSPEPQVFLTWCICFLFISFVWIRTAEKRKRGSISAASGSPSSTLAGKSQTKEKSSFSSASETFSFYLSQSASSLLVAISHRGLPLLTSAKAKRQKQEGSTRAANGISVDQCSHSLKGTSLGHRFNQLERVEHPSQTTESL